MTTTRRIAGALVSLALVTAGGCGQRVHVLGRVFDASAVVADASDDLPDVHLPADTVPEVAVRDSATRADVSRTFCREGTPCEGDGTRCLQPCAIGDTSVVTCLCTGGAWGTCEPTASLCGTRALCSDRACEPESPDCYYCDGDSNEGTQCQCQSSGWACQPLGSACR